MYIKSENVQSELRNCKASLLRKGCFFSSFKSFFSSLRHSPCGRASSSTAAVAQAAATTGSALQVSMRSTWPPADPELQSGSICWLLERRMAKFKGLWACQRSECVGASGPSLRMALILGEPLVKARQARTTKMLEEARLSDDPACTQNASHSVAQVRK